MKKVMFMPFLLLLIMISSCTQEEQTQQKQVGPLSAQLRNEGNVAICHAEGNGSFHVIYVNENAVQAHLNHGDYLPDADGDGFTRPGACIGEGNDCNDEDATIYPGATEIPDDGIDQDCNGEDEITLKCNCFSKQELEALLEKQPWSFGWYSDVPGCKAAPYDQLLELWITNIGLPEQNYNFSAQAGFIAGSPFASSAIFNHKTGKFDKLCGGYTTSEISEPCRKILKAFIEKLKVSHPTWDYCERF